MIESAAEFVRLRTSTVKDEYDRAAHDEAPLAVWLELVARYPEMRFWVAQNKTVPVEVLEALAGDRDPRVRYMVTPPEILKLLLGDPSERVVACARERLRELCGA